MREADYNETKLRQSLNVSSENNIKQSGRMQDYIRQKFVAGTEYTVQEAKSMLKQVYKKMGLNVARGITVKELERYAEIETGRNREVRTIKILEYK